MKPTQVIALAIALVVMCSCNSLGEYHTLSFEGNAGTFVIKVNSPKGLIEATHEKMGKLISGTNVICSLVIADDGAVHTITLKNGGRVDIDLITRRVDTDTGITQIMNPEVYLDGQTIDIVKAWTELNKTDARFQITYPFKEARGLPLNATSRWESLMLTDGCLSGHQNWSAETLPKGCVLYNPMWQAFLHASTDDTVPFLLKRLDSQQPTKIHVCPLENALEGELAVYALQHILQTNWFQMKSDNFSIQANQRRRGRQQAIRNLLNNRETRTQLKKFFHQVWIDRDEPYLSSPPETNPHP